MHIHMDNHRKNHKNNRSNSRNNHKNSNGSAEVQKKIIEFMKKEAKITTTSEIASKMNISWNTAEKYLLELTIEGKVERIKKIGVNLWVLKNES